MKSTVHPGFPEVIRQMLPDEARVMRYMHKHELIPIIIASYTVAQGGSIRVISNFSDIGYKEDCQCDYPQKINLYFDNLIRLGLLEKVTTAQFTDTSVYEPLKQRLYALSIIDDEASHQGQYTGIEFEKGYIRITGFGKAFCSVCMGTSAEN